MAEVILLVWCSALTSWQIRHAYMNPATSTFINEEAPLLVVVRPQEAKKSYIGHLAIRKVVYKT